MNTCITTARLPIPTGILTTSITNIEPDSAVEAKSGGGVREFSSRDHCPGDNRNRTAGLFILVDVALALRRIKKNPIWCGAS
jgi:hypothetical protein